MEKKLLDKLHDEQVKILDEIDRICEENNIQYFLMFGSLLGAVRHKDFIPWDDDIDIAMPRKDYEKFLKIASNKLSDPYILDYITTNKKYYLPFAKVRNKNTVFNERNSKKYKGNKGIYVDVFPFDYVDDINTTKFKNRFKLVLFLSKLLAYKSIQLYKKNIIFNILVFMARIIPNVLIIKIINSLVKSASTSKKANYIVHFCGVARLEVSCFKTKDVLPTKKIKFHGKYYMGVNDFNNVLTDLYNNYMELPPIDKRRTHNPLNIKFSDGEEHFFEGSDEL